jgi:macrolide-specific efflux system membrane fusion protein
MSRRKTIWIVASIVLIGAAAGIYVYLNRTPAPAYREVAVARGDIEVTVLATGVVRPRNRLEIKPPIAGRAEQVLVKEGQDVQKGAVLAWMSSSERAALLDAARARGPEELRRWEELYRPTPVIAPIGGTIIVRKVEPGQSFTAQDAMLVMSDRLIVVAQVDETDMAQVRPGQKAVIVADAFPERPIEATVSAVAFEAKTVSNVTTYEVNVLPQKVPAFLRAGMTASVRFRVAARRSVLLVPSAAVRQRDGAAYVLMPAAKPGGEPAERAVETGLTDGRDTEITAGLEESQPVLLADVRLGDSRVGGGNPLSGYGRPRSSGQRQR